jgi:hypothetical protein
MHSPMPPQIRAVGGDIGLGIAAGNTRLLSARTAGQAVCNSLGGHSGYVSESRPSGGHVPPRMGPRVFLLR